MGPTHLLTAIERPSSQAELAEMMGTAATDPSISMWPRHRFINKGIQLLRPHWLGARGRRPALPIRQLRGAAQREEQIAGGSPVALVTLLERDLTR